MDTADNDGSLPQFAEGPPMPEMCEAILSDDDVERLFEDLAACTSVVGVQEKGSEHAYAEQGPGLLNAAKSRLLNRSVRALQIRYDYQGHDWTDTLICFSTGIRLVRCQHVKPAAASAIANG